MNLLLDYSKLKQILKRIIMTIDTSKLPRTLKIPPTPSMGGQLWLLKNGLDYNDYCKIKEPSANKDNNKKKPDPKKD